MNIKLPIRVEKTLLLSNSCYLRYIGCYMWNILQLASLCSREKVTRCYLSNLLLLGTWCGHMEEAQGFTVPRLGIEGPCSQVWDLG